MGKCGGCGEPVSQASRFCSSCGAPVDAPRDSNPAVTEDVAPPVAAPSPAKKPSSRPRTPASPSSSGLSSEGRFLPGTLLAGRYRIIALLGKGGMGEVYRADDLTLAQGVALKFLPETVDKDEGALQRFHNEIRIARRVSHPNVCRVYDVGQVESHTFLSMEYVDGEDLAALLRRIGRLPGDKALEIARQLCAGLAAAHREGILHRDLKPANIMLDGRGRAVMMDFGLAQVAEQIEGIDARSGTPAYMAPEQLAGREVTVRSDIYSLGLVLYEIFTGKRAFAAETLAELIKLRNQEPLKTPSIWVRDLDPAVERVILRCLETEPAARPSGALAVAAALPGGDPLAAALAAGETPSPQMVAAAGETTGFAPRTALASLGAVVVGLASMFWIGLSVSGLRQMNGLLPPDVLSHKAQETLARLGYADLPVDSAAQFYYNTEFTDYVHDHTKPRPDWAKVLAGRPQVLKYSYRQAPIYLDPEGFEVMLSPGVVTFDDPPPTQSGMINLVLDAQGRLSYLQAIPKEVETNPPPAQPVDWKALFDAAGLDLAQFHKADPQWLSLAAFDERAAWTGTWPGSAYPLRVEAAAWRGKPVFFHLIGPWTTPDRSQYQNERTGERVSKIMQVILAILLLGAGAFLARRNYVKGKSDARGALRLASAVFVVSMVFWECLNHFVPTLATLGHLVLATAGSLFIAGAIWTFYVALEPYVRRHWPHAIISWTRLLGGKWRDALVARDFLWGVLLGVVWSVIVGIGLLGLQREGATPGLGSTNLLMGTREMVGSWLLNIINSVLGTLEFFLVLFLLRVILRNRWLAMAAFVAIFTLLNTLRSDHPQYVWMFWLPVYAIAAGAVTRFGLVVLATGFFTANSLLNLPYSLDFSNWYTPHVAATVLGFLALATWGFYTSLGGQKVWKDDLFE